MFSHLKKLIFDNVGKRRSRRPDRLPRFRGQLEQLESRTVLSATMGPMAIEFVAISYDANFITVVTVWESRPAPAQHVAIKSFNQFGDARWESLAWHDPFGGPGPRSGLALENDLRPPLAATSGNDQSSTGAGRSTGAGAVTSDFAEDHNTNPQPKGLPLGLNAGNQMGTSSFVNATGELRGQRGPAFVGGGNLTGAESYFSSLANSSSSAALGTSVQRSSLKTQDTIFDAYSADSLLLASNVDSKHDLRLDAELDDKFDSHDEKLGSGDDSRDSLVERDVIASLDALQRERAAVDAVLAELHEIKLNRESHRSDSTSADQTRNRAAAEASDRETITDADRMGAQPAHQAADGGMVLLQTSGDANSSAYDLTAVYLSGLGENAAVPLGVEASVGMYQAIDIGTSELRPARRETLPFAQPAGATHPSVSAENAPAKKSEQPS